MIAEIVCPWDEQTDPVDGVTARQALVTSFLIQHFDGESWSVTDATNQPVQEIDAGLVVVSVTCLPAHLTAIAADSRFLVLWSEA